MAQVTLKGNPVQVNGNLPQAGAQAPAFSLVGEGLADKSLKDYAGKRKVLNIFPSVDTPTCATSVRKFNAQANDVANTVVLCISADLPFAQARFCGAEGLENVKNLSTCAAASSSKTTAWPSPMARWLAWPPAPWWCWTRTIKCCTASWSAKSLKNRTTRLHWRY